MSITLTLTSEQEAWLRAQVASGDFASVEEAARQLIDERIAEIAEEAAEEFDWAAPLLEEARASVAKGEMLSLAEHRRRSAARRARREG